MGTSNPKGSTTTKFTSSSVRFVLLPAFRTASIFRHARAVGIFWSNRTEAPPPPGALPSPDGGGAAPATSDPLTDPPAAATPSPVLCCGSAPVSASSAGAVGLLRAAPLLFFSGDMTGRDSAVAPALSRRGVQAKPLRGVPRADAWRGVPGAEGRGERAGPRVVGRDSKLTTRAPSPPGSRGQSTHLRISPRECSCPAPGRLSANQLGRAAARSIRGSSPCTSLCPPWPWAANGNPSASVGGPKATPAAPRPPELAWLAGRLLRSTALVLEKGGGLA
mmetsp:Transcript_1750/g.3688  ORF Transcript_1750/g.3688 Transcript_1750/m.3688 type:complete len:277 (+) Transcript_1750:267-1097(+)